jgi:hypothetical protein
VFVGYSPLINGDSRLAHSLQTCSPLENVRTKDGEAILEFLAAPLQEEVIIS